MAQLRRDYQIIVNLDTEVIVVGPEDEESFLNYWKKEELPFIGLPDPDHTVLKRYGQEVNLFKLGRMPAQMIIDKSGTLRFVHYGHSMADIPGNDETIRLLESINEPSPS